MTSPPVTARAPQREETAARPGARLYAGLVWSLVAAAVIGGALMRAWYLAHRPVSSDEAVVGLMARQILHGHFQAFYWGQSYGGAEPYVVSAAFAVFGASAWVLRAVPVVLSAAAAVLTWRIARRLVPDRRTAVLVGAAVWATPDSAVSNSFIEWGFRGVTLVCGLGLLLLVLRILDGDRRWPTYTALGLIAGVGWWSSPEIAYYLVPGLLLLGWAAVTAYRDGRRRWMASRAGIAAGAAVVGALPWLWANAHSHLRSLRSSAFGNPPHTPTYTGKLNLFFHHSVPMLLSLQDPFTGRWLGGKALAVAVLAGLVLIIGAALVVCLRSGGPAAAIAAGVVVFPLLLAASPATWYWLTGRYVGYVVPLYLMVLAVGTAAAGRWAAHRWVGHRAADDRRAAVAAGAAFALVGAVLLASTFASFVKDPTPAVALSAPWGDPNGPTTDTVRQLEQGGVSEGYANYWVSYRLDFLSHGRLNLTVGKGEFDRWPALDRRVRNNQRAAWIFVKPSRLAAQQFVTVGPPGGLSESGLLAQLRLNNLGFHIVNTDLVQAVVPDQPVPAAGFWPGSG